MSHLKKIAMPRSWPLPRTGTKYIAKARPGIKQDQSLPILVVLRDMLKIATTRSEIKKILYVKEVLVNGKIIGDDKSPVGFFDVITIPKLKKSYKIIFSKKGKLGIEEAKESENKISKVIGKTILPGNKQQINLLDGNNILSKEKVKVNDSVIFSLKNKKIIKIVPLREKAEVYIIAGKHIGEKGTIEKIENKNAIIKIEKKSVNIGLGNIFVMD
jgi:small subunit ribosomal protein S4e